MRRKIKYLRFDGHLRKKLKDEEFKRFYELERLQVALAQKFAELREREHLKQSELARKMRVSQQFISQIETGTAKNLCMGTLLRLCKSLNKHITIKFESSGKRNKNQPLFSIT
ncbi:MAG: helix-turn-helix transcriptional regulator [Candidatus Omnitrophica bacterium]|nr:helix-turn-helix transcriptional regulator [Candidatus Omnitrophota bacterium]